MTEFTREQIGRLSDSLLIDMKEAHEESRFSDEDLLDIVKKEIAERAIGQSQVGNSHYLNYDKKNKATDENTNQN